jgi:hypothetical protein
MALGKGRPRKGNPQERIMMGRAIYYMHHCDGLKMAEIARQMQVNGGTAWRLYTEFRDYERANGTQRTKGFYNERSF